MPKYSVQCSFNSLVPENEFDLEESDPTFGDNDSLLEGKNILDKYIVTLFFNKLWGEAFIVSNKFGQQAEKVAL